VLHSEVPFAFRDRHGLGGFRWLASVLRDLRYAIRVFLRSPGFTLAAVLTLALGLGAATAIFSLVDAVLLRTLPVDRPHELVFFKTMGSERASGAPPYPWFERVRDDSNTFADMAVFASDEMRIEIDGRAEQVFGQQVSGSFFDTLGLEPVAGRLLTPDDENLTPPVAVIDYNYWQQRFGGSSSAIGANLTFGPHTYTIVGVTPRGFSGLQPGRRVELTTPLERGAPILRNGLAWWSEAVGRLQPGVSIDRATASADAAFQAHMQTVPMDPQLRLARFQRVETVSAGYGLGGLRDRYATSLQALMALAVAVLLIGCGNLGSLLLVRGQTRAREMAIRQATGASGARLLRQLLTETLLLFALGAAAGVAASSVAVAALVRFFAVGRNAIELDARIDWRAAAFAAAVALVAAIITGLWPALRAMRASPERVMRDGDTRVGGDSRRRSGTRVLVVGQVAICFTLLVSAMLFATTMANLRQVDLGFTPERVLTQSIDPMTSGGAAAEQRAQLWTRVLERIQELPGARAASLSVLTPMSGRNTREQVGGPSIDARRPVDRSVHLNHVSEDYFNVFSIGLVDGRLFATADRSAAVALVNETASAELFGGRSPVGETLELGQGSRFQIVGVVRDAKHLSLREPRQRMIYVPLWQPYDAPGRVTLSVATQQAPMLLAGEIARLVQAIDPRTLVSDVVDVETQVDATLISERLLAAIGKTFAVLALTLAAIGIYGVLSSSVAGRRREIAVRMALGAQSFRVAREVWRDVQWQLAAGIALGLPAAWAALRMAQALLFDVTPLDIRAYLLAIAVLAAVAVGAALLPLRRAVSLNPAEVMRQ
jgi:predicted permease